MARILIIEDETAIRANLVRFARLEGHEAVEAVDGSAGLAAAQTCEPDLILCDLMMPGLSGMQVLAALRQLPALAPIPFIFLSASAEPERIQEARQLGAREYLAKPFNLAQLREVLRRYLPDLADPAGKG